LKVMGNHFMKITFGFVSYRYHSFRGDFYLSKCNGIRIIVKYIHCRCSILKLCDQENIDQMIQKTLIYINLLVSIEGF